MASAAALGAGLYPNHHVRELPSPIVVISTDVINEDPTQSKPPKDSLFINEKHSVMVSLSLAVTSSSNVLSILRTLSSF